MPGDSRADEERVMAVVFLGTTICPILFFWQASQDVEYSHRCPAQIASTRHHIFGWDAS